MTITPTVFISYCHVDETWKDRLVQQLGVLELESRLTIWEDRHIAAGDDWLTRIETALGLADAAILVISAEFLTSEFIRGVEVPHILERRRLEGVRVIPLIVRPCAWDRVGWLARLNCLPRDGKPLSGMSDHQIENNLAALAKDVDDLLRNEPQGIQRKINPQSSQGDLSQADPKSTVDELEKLLLQAERDNFINSESEMRTLRINELASQIRARGPYVPGDTVAGTTLERVLGSGSFATIWLAKTIGGKEYFATKILDPNKLTQGVMLWRFRRSIRAISRLNEHRGAPLNIVRLYEINDDELAFSMEYLPEGNLEGIDRRGWGLDRKVQVFLEICRATAFAHRLGVIHRDIKPANVVFDSNLRPILTDFDIADIQFVTQLSVASGGLGTPTFAAPEQLENADLATEQSDIYSLGRLLYYILLERPPSLRIEKEPSLEDLSDQPPALVAVVRNATKLSPKDRYQDVATLVRAVENYSTKRAILRARMTSAWYWALRNRSIISIFLLILMVSIGFSTYHASVANREATLRRNLEDAVEQAQSWQTKFDNLSSQKINLREEINRLQTEEQVLLAKIDSTGRESESRIQLEGELAEIRRQLSERAKEQKALDSLLEEAKEEVEVRRRQLEELRSNNDQALTEGLTPDIPTEETMEVADGIPLEDISHGATVTIDDATAKDTTKNDPPASAYHDIELPFPTPNGPVTFSQDGERIAYFRSGYFIDGRSEGSSGRGSAVAFSPFDNSYYYIQKSIETGGAFLYKNGQMVADLGTSWSCSINAIPLLNTIGHAPGIQMTCSLDIWFSSSSDSYLLAIEQQDRTWKILKDDRFLPLTFSGLAPPMRATLSPDGSRFAIALPESRTVPSMRLERGRLVNTEVEVRGYRVFIDGSAGPYFDKVKDMHFMQPGNILIYRAYSDGKWVLMEESDPMHEGNSVIGEMIVSADSRHFAIPTLQPNGLIGVLIDGRLEVGLSRPDITLDWRDTHETQQFLSTLGSFTWTSDYSSHAYVAHLNEEDHDVVIHDGEPLATHDEVVGFSLTLTPDGKHLAYSAREGESWMIVVDGTEVGAFDKVSYPVFLNSTGAVAYAAMVDDGWFVRGVRDSDMFTEICCLRVSSDGHLAFAAKGSSDKWQIYIDFESVYQPFDALVWLPNIRSCIRFLTTGSLRIVGLRDGYIFWKTIHTSLANVEVTL